MDTLIKETKTHSMYRHTKWGNAWYIEEKGVSRFLDGSCKHSKTIHAGSKKYIFALWNKKYARG